MIWTRKRGKNSHNTGIESLFAHYQPEKAA